MFAIGNRVERNPLTWVYGNQDGGAGSLGTVDTVTHHPTVKQVVSVTWDKGGMRSSYQYHHQHLQVTNQSEKVEVKEEVGEILEYRRRNLAIYENMAFTDFTITCKTKGEEHKFPCHKANIAAASGHFARMFESGMTEVSNAEVEIQGYARDEVEHFIKYLYVPKMDREVLEKSAIKFLKISDQYDVSELKADVIVFLESKLKKDTVLDIVLAAHSYNAPELKTAAIKFIVKNKVEKDSWEEWRLALKDHNDLLLDIFFAFC